MSADRPESAALVAPCVGDTYLGWGTDEDGVLLVTIECDGGVRGDCGWKHDLTDEFGLTVPEWEHLIAQHLAHRAAQGESRG